MDDSFFVIVVPQWFCWLIIAAAFINIALSLISICQQKKIRRPKNEYGRPYVNREDHETTKAFMSQAEKLKGIKTS